MPLFYTPDIDGPSYTLSEEESRHCVRVLRLEAGAVIDLTDGRGTLYTGRIVSASPKGCRVEVTERVTDYGKRPYVLMMAVAPTKNNERLEWFLEKSTEIGIDRIVPLLCDRSERRVYKTERGNKVIESAMKQSLSAYHPQLDEITPFVEVVRQPFEGDKFIAHCAESAEKILLRDGVRRGVHALILIGPEGDFSPEEIQLAREHGFREVSLGSSRLRTETAALVACHTVALINE
ncbi:MAG: 16S rRNA (uracil(1498)-N(3))-methyltransferase [Rikenellaceae bacterium]|jgi:16S rRNA (uracil1498-N3)-methyltransferase|nr:16S rRNA (uracil(1498)-N(3))-methyltransferase [Rikenellaceae bacterium]